MRLIENRARGIAEVAERVGRGDFGSRIAVTGSRDAFDRLAAALNEAFARIELLVSELRTVTDGLAHDLRSPITRLGHALDAARRSTDSPETLAALERAGRETEGLEHILGTALQIVRLEAGIGRDRFAPLDIGEVLHELAELFEPAAEEAGFAIVVEAPAHLFIDGHRHLIAQAIGNLIDNAMHYAQGGRRIAVSAARAGEGRVVVSVADDGPGIPAERRADALRRFGRLDPARHQPGSRLGLSLVAAAAALHGGSFELGDAEPGLVARLTLGDAAAARG
ncbi:MAG: ATP-binding protein [Erythrobacter sp.]